MDRDRFRWQRGTIFKIARKFLFLNILTLTVVCKAQPLSFTHLTSENGLSNNSVLSIAQDGQGFIWLGTADGLNRYDGFQIKIYTAGTRPGSGLYSDNILSLFHDSKKQLWVGSSGGLNRYNDKTDDFERIHLPVTAVTGVNCIYEDRKGTLWIGTTRGLFTSSGENRFRAVRFKTTGGNHLPETTVKSVFEDHAGNIWIGASTKLIRMWRQDRQYHYEAYYHHPADPGSLSSDNITSICEDESHNLWIGTQSSGLNLYQPSQGRFLRFSKTQTPGLIHNNIRTLLVKNRNELWIGTQEGLSILNTATREVVSYQNDGRNNKSLSQNSIYSLYKDANGSVWVGTYFGGANRADAYITEFNTIHNDGSQNTIVNNVVSSILEDKNSDLWIGTEGGGLVLFDRRNARYQTFKNDISNPSSIGSNLVKVVYLDKQGNVWCGTHGGGLNLLNRSTGTFERYLYKADDAESAGMEIQSIQEDGEGRFWLATNAGIRVFRKSGTRLTEIPVSAIEEKISRLTASKIYEDSKGTVWIGGISGLYTVQGHQFRTISTGISVNTFLEDANGDIWAGGRNGILAWYHKKTQQLTQYRIPAGGTKNIVGILQDDQGYLWLSTDEGLLKFDPALKTVIAYAVADGLAGKEFNYNSYLKDSKGEFYFGGYRGITHFFPDRIRVNQYHAPLIFTNLRLNNNEVKIGASDGLLSRNISHTRRLTFQHDQNLFTINFALLNFIKSNKNRYSYRLEGFDKDWKTARVPAATYTNLPPGNYIFSVKGANNDGIWTEPITLKITVLPPFWRTWWAYTLYTLIFIGILFLITRFFFLRALLKKEDELHQVKLNFFTNVSHELRTHLSLIMAPIEKLLDINRADHFTTQQIKQIKNNSNRLLKLVSELMDFRKAESDHLKLQVKEQDLIIFLQEIYISFRELSLAKNIQISYTHTTPQARLYFDEKQLEKVFFNLLANAFKFTPEGGRIAVTVTTHKTFTEVTVADTGRGIAAAYLSKLFTNYYQVADHGMQNTGYGLGLALSKKITELHGGTIRVESTPATAAANGHTCFFVTLLNGSRHFEKAPNVSLLKQPTDGHTAGTGSPVARGETGPLQEPLPAGRSHTVLIVEDNPDLRTLIKQHLEGHYRVQEAVDGLQGWDAAAEGIPDLIISDVTMPGLSGMELCNRLKTDQRTSHIPVILLTARNTQTDQIEGLENGADVYITKPFSTKVLELNIRNLLETRRKLQQKNMREFTRLSADARAHTGKEAALTIDTDYLLKVTGIIDSHLEDPDFGVDKLSRKVAMSAPVLYKKIRALTNMSVNEFIKTRRFKKAAELILQKNLTINEISYAVGYDDRKYFSKEFKKHFGVAPSDFNQTTLDEHRQTAGKDEQDDA